MYDMKYFIEFFASLNIHLDCIHIFMMWLGLLNMHAIVARRWLLMLLLVQIQ